MVNEVISDDCGCDGDYSDAEVYTEGEYLDETISQDQVQEECQCESDCSCNVDPMVPGDVPAPSHEGVRRPGFLKRFGGWLHQ